MVSGGLGRPKKCARIFYIFNEKKYLNFRGGYSIGRFLGIARAIDSFSRRAANANNRFPLFRAALYARTSV